MKNTILVITAVLMIMSLFACDSVVGDTKADLCSNTIAKIKDCQPELEAYIDENYGSDASLQISSQQECEDAMAGQNFTSEQISASILSINSMDCDTFTSTYGPELGVVSAKLKNDLDNAAINSSLYLY